MTSLKYSCECKILFCWNPVGSVLLYFKNFCIMADSDDEYDRRRGRDKFRRERNDYDRRDERRRDSWDHDR